MKLFKTLVLASVVAVGLASQTFGADKETKKVDGRYFEMRTYYTAQGKMDALHARFRDHTCKLFEKHGMTIIGFWSPADPVEGQKKLVYILAYPSKEARDKSWKEFQTDPEWIAARKESEKQGIIVTKVEQLFLNPTDYSPMK
jgi:hypothetical protein